MFRPPTLWASEEEILEEWYSRTRPVVYCESIERERHRLMKVLGLLNAAVVAFALDQAVVIDRLNTLALDKKGNCC